MRSMLRARERREQGLDGGASRRETYSGWVALLVAGCGGGGHSLPPSEPSPLLATPAPDFRRPTLDGSALETSTFRGRVVVIDFFAEHCTPCVRSLPAIEALHRAM